MTHFKRLISQRDAGNTLLSYLRRNLSLSGKEIKRLLDRGFCQCNRKIERFGSILLKQGDSILFILPERKRKKKPQLSVLFEDEHLYLCNKEAGLVTDRENFLPFLPGNIFLVHRLDKGTSGILAVARTVQMKKRMEKLFFEREVSKTYIAIVRGEVKREKGTICNHLVRRKSSNGQMFWEQGHCGVLAITHWNCIKRLQGASILRCVPETGRSHQIRVHLSGMGHPILGDFHYGRDKLSPGQEEELLLHAYMLGFSHPITGKYLEGIAPLPKYFKRAEERREP